MINNDALINLVLKMDAFMMKKGHDLRLKREIIDGINTFIGNEDLETIYVNEVDNINVPDVFVMPIYDKKFNTFMMDPDITTCCPYGYTVEIHNRCFDKYKSEELVAIVIHHILQNVQSDVAKSRFMRAYTEATRKYSDEMLLAAFDSISHSDAIYMAYVDICLRPFNVPTEGETLVGTDDVIKNIGLADAFDSALDKMLFTSDLKMDADKVINKELANDVKALKTIFQAGLNNELHRYFSILKNGVPLITLQNIMQADKTGTVLGLKADVSVHRARKNAEVKPSNDVVALSESIFNPKDEIELQYQIDKIITDMRFMEHADERAALLFRTRTLSMKVLKTKDKVAKKLEKAPGDKNLLHKIEYLDAALDQLDMMREKIVKTDIKAHKVGLVVKYPTGYNY